MIIFKNFSPYAKHICPPACCPQDVYKRQGVSIADLNMQLGFLWEELQGYTAVMDALKKAGSVRAASDAVLTGYEKPADQSETVKKKRAEYGEGYYKKYAAGNGTKYYSCLLYTSRCV